MAYATRLPQVSDCFAPIPRTISLNDRRVVQVVFCSVVVMILGLAHVHLHFAMRDARLQHSRMQQQRHALIQAESRMRHDIEGMCDSSRLRAYGREMEMVETRPNAQMMASVPAELKTKYMAASASPVQNAMQASLRTEDLTVQSVLFRLADANKAFAADAAE
jgi:hypothetical protein